jgi:glycosyltransferase involved in cell wall biosynthesis
VTENVVREDVFIREGPSHDPDSVRIATTVAAMNESTRSSRDGPPIEVVYVVASMITGGTQTHLLQVFRFLDRRRHVPRLFCLRDEGNLIPDARALDVEVSTFGMSGTLRSPRDLTGLLRMRAALRVRKPGILHGYLLRGNFYGAIAARAARVRVVVTSKRGHHKPASAPERLAVHVSNRLSDAITGNSPAVLDFTRAEETGLTARLVMIPSGIDTDRFDPRIVGDLSTELGLGVRPVIGTAITWRPRKGFRMLFEAFAQVLSRRPDARLLIAGEGEWAPDPRSLAEALGIRDSIVLLGKRSDMPRVLGTLDVFVLPSESEGMSNALLEAMAMALPAIATDVGGNPHVITNGDDGFLVRYADSDTLASRIEALLGDEQERRRIGNAARQRVVGAFSARSMVGQLQDLYDELWRRGAS